MATASPPSPGGTGSVDPAPLLSTRNVGNRSRRGRGVLRASRFLRRASSRHMITEPSMMVRETAAEHLEERQSDWAYSKPVVFLDIMWNLAFVGAGAGVLIMSRYETPSMPLRLWIVGYALQCFLHMVCVCVEYRRRQTTQRAVLDEEEEEGGSGRITGSNSPRATGEVVGDEQNDSTSVVKHLESANTMFSFIWWIVGFYWVSVGGQELTRDSPQLYWLCIVFLAFDVFFVVFCVALACVIGIAVCCCLPCIIAILYAVADQEGASEEDICQLPKYKFRRIGDPEKLDEISGRFSGIMIECGSDSPAEHVLSAEDAECCICLSPYEDGAELRELPCSHHFHCGCIDKWLHINAVCPLCKFHIIESNNHGREEV